MIIRRAETSDREAMLGSFRPLFEDWDYLPLVIDDWLIPSSGTLTWLACAGPEHSQLVAMMQAYELAPGDWYLRGLRSNPNSRPDEVGRAILALRRTASRELSQRHVEDVRYGTLDSNEQSLRLARLLGLREHFRLAHAYHPLPPIPAGSELKPDAYSDPDELHGYFTRGFGQSPAREYYFTWWDTRRLLPQSIEAAQRQNLLLEVRTKGRLLGAALFWLVPWQKFMVFSLMEGTDEALSALYRAGVLKAHALNCKAIGLVHPSLDELHRRQTLFGLAPCGCETVQLRICTKSRSG